MIRIRLMALLSPVVDLICRKLGQATKFAISMMLFLAAKDAVAIVVTIGEQDAISIGVSVHCISSQPRYNSNFVTERTQYVQPTIVLPLSL